MKPPTSWLRSPEPTSTTERSTAVRPFLILSSVCAAGALILVSAGLAGQPVTQTLNPPPPSWQTCKAVGSGTICEGTKIDSYGPYDTGLVCGSSASAFDIFDAGIDDFRIRKFFDANGNLVRRVFYDHFTFGQFSNPLSGATVPYTQTETRTDVLAVPGDLSTTTETITVENIYRPAGGAPVLIGAGRAVFAPDGTVEFAAGPSGLLDLLAGNTSALEPLCAALGAA
jgi:hypothetical protein